MDELYSDAHISIQTRENNEEIITKLHDSQDYQTLLSWINLNLPNWIQEQLDDYAEEYTFLALNWAYLCVQWKTEPKQILIVEFLPNVCLDPDYKEFEKYRILQVVIDGLSKNGFIIRKKSEIVACKGCQKALLSKEIYDFFKSKPNSHKKLPKVWNEYCLNCQESILNL